MTGLDQRQKKSRQATYGSLCITYVLPLIIILILYTGPLASHGSVVDPVDLVSDNMRYITWAEHPFALWNNLWSGGMPNTGSPHDDRYYPFSFPFYLLSQNLLMVNILLITHLYIAYLTMRRLAGLATDDTRLLLLAGLGYAFSGALLSRLEASHVYQLYALAWLPLIYDSFLRILEGKIPPAKGAVYFALAFTVFFFTGSVYFPVFATITLAIIFICYLVMRRVNRATIATLVPGAALGGLLLGIKIIPDLIITPFLERMEPIDPLGGGALMERSFSTFVTGYAMNTDLFGYWESAVLIGAVPLILVTVCLLFEKRVIALSGFATLVFALVWADAGNTLFSFIHLAPGLITLRCPGRIYSVVLPLVFLLATYGAVLLAGRIKRNESLVLDDDGWKRLALMAVILAVIKLSEIPFQTSVTVVDVASILLVAGFVVMLALGGAAPRRILMYLGGTIIIGSVITLIAAPGSHPPDLVSAFLIAIVTAAGFYALSLWHPGRKGINLLCAMMVISLILSIGASTAYVTGRDTGFDDSPMKAVINEIAKNVTSDHQVWIMETGYRCLHMDLAYYATLSGIHHSDSYYPYYLAHAPDNTYIISGKGYTLADYLVDTAPLEKGKNKTPNATFTVEGIGILKLGPVLPDAFVIHAGDIAPSQTTVFSPDRVIVKGRFAEGDTAVLKYAFAPGWTVNGVPASRINNLTGAPLLADTDTVTFAFSPVYFFVGAFLTLVGMAGCILLLVNRRRFDAWVDGLEKRTADVTGEQK
jgi:hypothetical protein